MNDYYEIPSRYLIGFRIFLLLVGVLIVVLMKYVLAWSQLPYLSISLVFLAVILGLFKLKYSLWFFIFLIPLLSSIPSLLDIPVFYPIEIVFLTVLLLWAAKSVFRKNIKLVRTCLDIPLVVFLLIVFTSCLLTLVKINHLFSSLLAGNLKETLQKISVFDLSTNMANLSTLRYTVTIFEGVLCYFLLTNNLQSKDSMVKAVAIILASSAIVVGYGIFQYFTRFHLLPYWVRANPNLTRINSTLQCPNSLGSYLVLTIFLAGFFLWVQTGWKRLLLGLLSGGLGLCLIFSASRSAWFSFLLVSVAVLVAGLSGRVVTSLKKEPPGKHRRIIIITLLIFLSIFLISTLSLSIKSNLRVGKEQSYYQVLLSTLNPSNSLNSILKGRIGLWKAALKMVKEKPILGQGIGFYYWGVSVYYGYPRQSNAHSYYLQVWAELGTLGLAVFAWVLVIILRSGIKLLLQVKERYWKFLILGLTSGILAFLLTCLADHPLVLLEMQFIFWSFAGILLAIFKAKVWGEIR